MIGGASPRETPPAAMARYIELLRARAPHQRLAQAVALTRATRALALAGIRQQHPGASEAEVKALLAARLYGPDIARRVFGLTLEAP